ncbi:LP04239P family, partial [Trichomonas vaginalis G3]|uniref:LP04239P family n=1 Tax=Trichomonas vaginalis (strain ATCC PRA-98 / G3) TaxID=412133 RepID=UPI0021E59932
MNLYTLVDSAWLETALAQIQRRTPLAIVLTNVPLVNNTIRSSINKITFYKTLLCNRLITIEEYLHHTYKLQEFTTFYIKYNNRLYECSSILKHRDDTLLTDYLILQSSNDSRIQEEPSSASTPLQRQLSANTSTQQQLSANTPLQRQLSASTPLQRQLSSASTTNTPPQPQLSIANAPLQSPLSSNTPPQRQLSANAPLQRHLSLASSTNAPLHSPLSSNTPPQRQLSANAPLQRQLSLASSTNTPPQPQLSANTPLQRQLSANTLLQQQLSANTPPQRQLSANTQPQPHPSVSIPFKRGRPKVNVPKDLKVTIRNLIEQHGHLGIISAYNQINKDIEYAKSHFEAFLDMKTGIVPQPTPTQAWFSAIERFKPLNQISSTIPSGLMIE